MKRAGLFILILIWACPIMAQTKLTLTDAIRMSQEHSSSVKSSYYDSLGGMYDYGAARAQRYPTLSANASAFYINNLQHESTPFFNLQIGTHDNYQIDTRLTLPLYTGGKISNQIKIQREIAGARGFNLTAERQKNAYLTRKAYLGLMAAQAIAASSEASIDRIRLINNDVQNLYRSGMADSVDILDAELNLEKALASRQEKETAVANARANLARLIGFSSTEDVEIAGTLPIPDSDAYRDEKPGPETNERAEIQALEKRAKAANYTINLNKAYYLPTLSGYGGYSTGKPNRNALGDKWNDYWVAGLSFNWEFNLGGRTIYNVNSAYETASATRMAKNDLEENLILMANVALENLKLALINYTIAAREYEIAQQQYRHGLNQQQAGRLSVNRLLELEADLSSMEQLYRVSATNYFLSETEYLYAIGSSKLFGGF
jgi:outer membrane protein